MGTPASGSETVPSALTTRMLPCFSVTSTLPPGRKAMLQGATDLSVTVVTVYATPLGSYGACVCPCHEERSSVLEEGRLSIGLPFSSWYCGAARPGPLPLAGPLAAPAGGGVPVGCCAIRTAPAN